MAIIRDAIRYATLILATLVVAQIASAQAPPPQPPSTTRVPSGAVSLPDAAVITVPCPSPSTNNVYNIISTAAGHYISMPLCPASTGAFVAFNICNGTGGTGPCSGPPTGPYCGSGIGSTCALFGAGYAFPSSTPYAQSQVSGAWDIVSCQVQGTVWGCGSPQYAITGVTNPAPVIAAHAPHQCYGTGFTTCPASLSVTNGDTLIVGVGYCEDPAGCAASGTSSIGSIAVSAGLNPCVLAVGAKPPAATVLAAEVWWCKITSSSTVTVTPTWISPVSYPSVFLADVTNLPPAPDDGKGNYAGGTGALASVTLNGGTSVNNELLFAVAGTTNGTAAVVGNGYTLLDRSGGLMAEYDLTNTAGPNSATATQGASVTWGITGAGFLP